MNNGWSEHHCRLHKDAIDKLQRKLDEIKRDIGMQSTEGRAAKTFKRVVSRLPAESFKPFFKNVEGKSDAELESMINSEGDTPAATDRLKAELQTEEQQMGGA